MLVVKSMNILNICENGDVLSVIRIVKIVINIIRIVIPILLMIRLMLDYMHAVKESDNDALQKANKSAVLRVIACILLFMIPTFVNLIANVADPDNKTYVSCLNDATIEKINAAFVLKAEKDLDKATETLKRTDYQVAQISIQKIKINADKERLTQELENIANYVEIRESIYVLAENFNREDYVKLKEKIDSIEDESMKTRLSVELKQALGTKGTLAIYNSEPSDELYRNLRTLSGKTLASMLLEHDSSIDKLNLQIKDAVEMVGVGTREAPAAAAFTLIQTLAEYGYKINYDWGGKWHHVGIDGNFGRRITPQYCASHPNPDRCKTNLIWKGFDCSGFVSWALIQGFQDDNYRAKYIKSIPLAGKTESVCDVGDVLDSPKHIVLVVGHDESRKSYIVAESSNGVTLSYYKYNAADYSCRKIQYSN